MRPQNIVSKTMGFKKEKKHFTLEYSPEVKNKAATLSIRLFFFVDGEK